MSRIMGKLCSSILCEHFGPIVQCVGDDLFKHGPKTLGLIKFTTGLPLVKVKEALCVLIKFGFVTYNEKDSTEKDVKLIYSLDADKVLTILRYAKYIYFVKNCYEDRTDDISEMMLEQVLRSGTESASDLIVHMFRRLELLPPERRATIPVLKEKFELLVKNQFLMRSICTDKIGEMPTDKPDFGIPNLNIKSLMKRLQGNKEDAGDTGIYWRVNFDRFNQDLRDQILVDTITRRIDENAGQLMKQLLILMYLRTASWSDTSNPIPMSEIRESVRKLNYPMLSQYVDQYLKVIVEDQSKFVQRVGDSGGGQYSVNMKEAFHQLAWATIENVVLEKFGSKAARIYRLVRDKKYIEQERIHQLAMISAKEAKFLTFLLLEEKYVQMHELKKATTSMNPTKGFFLFYIDLDQVVRMVIEHCYHALYNLMQRKEHESTINRRMIDKKLRIETMMANLREHGAPQQQLNDIEEMMTPSEKLQLDKVHGQIQKLGMGETVVEQTLFILQMYLRYH